MPVRLSRLSAFSRQAMALTQRLALVIVGGYGLTSAVLSLGALAFATLMPHGEAVVLATILGFPLYLILLLWGLSERRIRRLWIVFGIGTIATQGVLLLYA